MTSPPIRFLRVANNDAKQLRLCTVAHEHFVKGERVLILAPSPEAAHYVDQLLWRLPPQGFIPHVIANSNINEKIVITTSPANINKAHAVINLTTQLPKDIGAAEVIYELLDLTTPEKEAASRSRIANYQQAGYTIEEV